MSDKTSKDIYSETANNKYRNFNMGNDDTYDVCSIYCDFDITKLKEKEYISGLTASSENMYLHLNPTVNTEPPQKGLIAIGDYKGVQINREKKIYIEYRLSGKGGNSIKYELIDIFIQVPSKVVLSGKRYPMESCLVFLSNDTYLVVCTPIDISSSNTTNNPLEKDLFTFFTAISESFPTKGKTYSVENVPDWNPIIFFPVKTQDNASFYTWIDKSTNNKVMYIQFKNPIMAPYNFYKTFSNTLVGSIDIAKQATSLPAQQEYAGLDIYYNENSPIDEITTYPICETKTNIPLQNMISLASKIEKKAIAKKKKEDEMECKKGIGEKCPTPSKPLKVWMYLFFILLTLGIAGILFFIYYKNKNKIPLSIPLHPIEMKTM